MSARQKDATKTLQKPFIGVHACLFTLVEAEIDTFSAQEAAALDDMKRQKTGDGYKGLDVRREGAENEA